MKARSLGVLEAPTEKVATERFAKLFPGVLDVVTPAFRGSETTL